MIRRLPLLFVLAAWPAQAEDFTGFYAGVNAGYGWNHESRRKSGTSVPAAPSADKRETDSALPPSASAAATALQRSTKTYSR